MNLQLFNNSVVKATINDTFVCCIKIVSRKKNINKDFIKQNFFIAENLIIKQEIENLKKK
jgi:hypothetical protein